MRLAAPAKCFVILMFALLIGCALWWSLRPMPQTPGVRIVGCFSQGESILQLMKIFSPFVNYIPLIHTARPCKCVYVCDRSIMLLRACPIAHSWCAADVVNHACPVSLPHDTQRAWRSRGWSRRRWSQSNHSCMLPRACPVAAQRTWQPSGWSRRRWSPIE